METYIEVVKSYPWLIIVIVMILLIIWWSLFQAYERRKYKEDIKGGIDAIKAKKEIIKNPEIDKEAKKMVEDYKQENPD